MFGVLELLPSSRRGILGRILDRIKPIPPTVSRLQLEGMTILLIRAQPDSRGKIPWEWVAEGLPDGVPLLLPRGLERPDFLPPPHRQRAEGLLLPRAAAQLLDSLAIPLYRKAVGLIDPAGEQQALAESLLPHASILRIATQEPERYAPFCQRMLEEYGAPVLLASGVAELAGSLFLLSPQPYGEEGPPPACPVLAVGEQRFSGRCQVVEQLRCSLSPQLEAALPPDIDPGDWWAAAVLEGWQGGGAIAGTCGSRQLLLTEVQEYIERRWKQENRASLKSQK